MKRQTGYFATQRRSASGLSTIRRTQPVSTRPAWRRRFVTQSHAVGYRPSTTGRWIGVAAAVAVCAVFGVIWARRR